VGVGEHDRVDGVQGSGLGNLEVRHLALGTGFVATVDEHAGFGGRENKTRAADLATTPQRGDADPLLVGHLLAVDLSADAFEDVTALVAFLFQEVADVRDGRGLDRRGADHLRRPADGLCDLTEGRAVAADHHPRFLGLDNDLTGVGVEFKIGDPGVVGDHLSDPFAGLWHLSQHVGVRTNGDTFAEFARERPDQVAVAGELLGVVRVHDQFGALVLYVGDGDTRG